VILVDTSVWVDHLRTGDTTMATLLSAGRVLVHSFVIGELALGNLRQRAQILADLHALPAAIEAEANEVTQYIERHQLHGLGIGYVDVHLLASAQLTAGASLWTRDRRLRDAAQHLSLAATGMN
jgi:predicted nucleic acid-binding protein